MIIFNSCQNKDKLNNENLLVSFKKKNALLTELYTDYLKDIEKVGFDKIVTAEHLIIDNDLSKADEKIKEAILIFNNFNDKNEKLHNDLLKIIDSIKPTKNFKSNDIIKIRKNLEKKVKDLKLNREIDSLGIDAYDKIKNFLKSKCKFEIIDNQIYFESEKCRKEYFKLSMNLTSIQYKGVLNEMKKKNIELQKNYGKY